MNDRIKAFEREEEDILADYDAGLISKREKDQAIKKLWHDYRELQEERKHTISEDWEF